MKHQAMPLGRKIKSEKLRRAYYCAFVVLMAVVVFATVYSLILPAITMSEQREVVVTKHSTLSYNMYDHQEKKDSQMYRAYYEYTVDHSTATNKQRNVETFGIPRQSVIYVYAYAGETICLGSDIINSCLDADNNLSKTPTGVDIVMIAPDGVKYTFDNTYDAETGVSKGYIGTTAQEKAGANFKNSNNTEGYTPHEYLVRKTGVYEIHFHSVTGICNTYKGGTYRNLDEPHFRTTNANDPVKSLVGSNGWLNTGATVGAFDAMVVSNGEVIEGRAYAKYLSLNMGFNSTTKDPTFYGDFYMVTTDGYIYNSRYALDPYGFIFFGDSRGVIDTENGFSAYHSMRAFGQSSPDNEMILEGPDDGRVLPYTVHNPGQPDTELDKTYMIFFEKPNEDLEGVVYNRAYAPEVVENFEFIGAKEDNITYVGNGGYFKFDISNAVSVIITIPFSEYTRDLPEDQKLSDVVIRANVVEGTNYVYWDGTDGNDHIVPVGWYTDGLVEVTIQSHAGEFHFPMMDVENSGGVRFERVNKIYEYEDNVIKDVTYKYEDSKYRVFYSNAIQKDNKNIGNPSENIADSEDNINGVDSEDFVMSFKNALGDYTLLDIWTYAVNSKTFPLSADIIVEDLDGYKSLNLEGNVFFDKDKSGLYNFEGGDFFLPNVEVMAEYRYCETRWGKVEKDENSNVITKLIPSASYSGDPDDEGNRELDYYHHKYEVELDTDPESETYNKYVVYQYSGTDRKHKGGRTLIKSSVTGETITVNIVSVRVADPDNEGEYKTIYRVWIPARERTTTNATGDYHFSGILINDKFVLPCAPDPDGEYVLDQHGDYVFFDDSVRYSLNDETKTYYEDENGSFVKTVNDEYAVYETYSIDENRNRLRIFVNNPNDEIYELTTAEVHTGDFSASDTGKDASFPTGQEFTLLDDIYPKIQTTLVSHPDKLAFTYSVADVGYYYDTYDKNIVVSKLWGSNDDANDVQEITFLLEAYSDEGGRSFTREVKVNFRGWSRTLNDLPEKDGEGHLLKYRIVSESFRKGSSYYRYTYNWGTEKGTYVQLGYDENGDEYIIKTYAEDEEPPYQTYISEVKHLYSQDEINVENWNDSTTTLSLVKYSAIDNKITLPDATFRLKKKNPVTNEYEYVRTATGIYSVTTDGEGKAQFKGLSPGQYRLIEWVPPENYETIPDIDFTVSEHGSTLNTNIRGNYKNGYYSNIYDSLSESPVSMIYKIDQYGNPVQGAELSIYKANNLYEVTDETPALSVTTDANGYARFIKEVDNGDGTTSEREMYISELMKLLNSRYFVLRETKVPAGYRVCGETHMEICGEGVNSIIICRNQFESGVWASPMASVYATDYLQMRDTSRVDAMKELLPGKVTNDGVIHLVDRNNNDAVSGTLFAVVLKREGAESSAENIEQLTGEGWAPVYGNIRTGFHIMKKDKNGNAYDLSKLNAVIDCAKKENGATVFEMVNNGSNNQLHASLKNFPGYVENYYSYCLQNDCEYSADNPEFLIGYFFSTASSLEGATVDNTVQISSHGFNDATEFPVYWSTEIIVPDVINTLFVQKRDREENLVENAVFALYNSACDLDGTGYYIGKIQIGNKYSEEEVYIRLAEDGSNKAYVYTATKNELGALTNFTSIGTGYYEVNTTGCDRVSEYSTSHTIETVGHVEAENAGTILVTIGDAVYTIKPALDGAGHEAVSFTHSDCTIMNNSVSAHMQKLRQGMYFLREVYAPKGFKLNYHNVEVIVGAQEIYANAGSANDDDGIRTGVGTGYVVPSLNQFLSTGDIDETLAYMVATLRLKKVPEETHDGFIDTTNSKKWNYVWIDDDNRSIYKFNGTEDTGGIGVKDGIHRASAIYLKFNGKITNADGFTSDIGNFDYVVNRDAYSDEDYIINADGLAYWTESGWPRLALFQHISGYNDSGHKSANYTNLTLTTNPETGLPMENDISNLFANATYVSVRDDSDIGIRINKISSTTDKPVAGAGFVLYKMENNIKHYYNENDAGEVSWTPLSAGQDERDYMLLTSEKVITSEGDDEDEDDFGHISYHSLEAGTYYLEELETPDGYIPPTRRIKVTIASGKVKAVWEGTGEPLEVDYLTTTETELDEETNSYFYDVEIPNATGLELPKTGGGGAYQYYTLGTLLLSAGAIMAGYILRRRREGRAEV